jgi:hypothetical protein
MFAIRVIAVNAKFITRRNRAASCKKLCLKSTSIAFVFTILKHAKMINWMSVHDFMCRISSVCVSHARDVRTATIEHLVKFVVHTERKNGVNQRETIAWPTSPNGFSQPLTTNMPHLFGHIMLLDSILTLSIIICAPAADAQKPA